MRTYLIAAGLLALVPVVACGDSTEAEVFQDGTSSGENASGGSSGSSGFGSSGGASGGVNADGGACAATVADPTKPKVDIIFVIDNSGSMNAEMNQIKTNVNTFASKIGSSGLDYTVMFIVNKATSPTQTGNYICVPTPLAGANCADNAPIFHHMNKNVQSTNSLTILQREYASGINWSQYLRPDSTKVFVEVTDDDSDVSETEFDNFLMGKAPMFGTTAKRGYIFHSIVGWTEGRPLTDSTRCSGSAGPGMEYRRLSTLTGGIVDSVCKTDYSGVLSNLAKGIADRLACELGVPTAASSDPTSMVVRAGSKTLTQVTDASKCESVPDAWYYDDNTKPTKIVLCKATCDAASGQKVEALVGCKAPGPK